MVSLPAVTYAQLLKLALGTAEGLAYLHFQPEPIIHRDIKPQNILVTKDFEVRLLQQGCEQEDFSYRASEAS